MKKILALFLSATFVLTLCACDLDDLLEQKSKGQAADKGGVTSKSSTDSTPSGSSEHTSQPNQAITEISADRAKEIALNDASLAENEVKFLKTELDKEVMIDTWEIEFNYGGYEYSYEINAESGEIITKEKEFDD